MQTHRTKSPVSCCQTLAGLSVSLGQREHPSRGAASEQTCFIWLVYCTGRLCSSITDDCCLVLVAPASSSSHNRDRSSLSLWIIFLRLCTDECTISLMLAFICFAVPRHHHHHYNHHHQRNHLFIPHITFLFYDLFMHLSLSCGVKVSFLGRSSDVRTVSGMITKVEGCIFFHLPFKRFYELIQ